MYTHHIMKSAGGVDMAVIKPKFKCDAVIFMIKKMMVRCGVAHHTSRTKETAVILRKMSCPSIISKTHLRTFFPYTSPRAADLDIHLPAVVFWDLLVFASYN